MVLALLRKLKLDRILHARPSRERTLCMAMIVMRLLEPGSKLATACGLSAASTDTTLDSLLDLGKVSAEDLYAALDWLHRRQRHIDRSLGRRHLQDGTLVLYDVTPSRYEGRQCPLARISHACDGRKNTRQIVFGLLCDAAGCPVAAEVYPGNTADPATLSDQIAKVRKRFGLKRVVFVDARGLLTSARIDNELRPVAGLDWISALRNGQVRKLATEGGPLQPSLFDEAGLAELRPEDFPGERLIACLNPLLREERKRKREDLLQATEALLDPIVAATQRPQRALRGTQRITEHATLALHKYRMAKHFDLEIEDNRFAYRRRQDAIAAEQQLDGICVIRTSVPAQELDAAADVAAYKSLSQVEPAFRCLKTVDLQVRTIRHHLDSRVRSHVLLCMLAYYVEWHLRRSWAPLLPGEDDPTAAERMRSSPVAKAARTPGIKRKLARRQTPDGYPLRDLKGLLRNLAKIARITSRQKGSGIEIQTHSPPSPYHQKALDLLGVQNRV